MKGVTIQLDVPRKVRFDGAGLMRLEELEGNSVVKMMRGFKDRDIGIATIVNLVTAGIYHEVSEATPEYVVALMEQNGKGDSVLEKITYYAAPVIEALMEAMGAQEKNVKGGLKAPKVSSGTDGAG